MIGFPFESVNGADLMPFGEVCTSPSCQSIAVVDSMVFILYARTCVSPLERADQDAKMPSSARSRYGRIDSRHTFAGGIWPLA